MYKMRIDPRTALEKMSIKNIFGSARQNNCLKLDLNQWPYSLYAFHPTEELVTLKVYEFHETPCDAWKLSSPLKKYNGTRDEETRGLKRSSDDNDDHFGRWSSQIQGQVDYDLC